MDPECMESSSDGVQVACQPGAADSAVNENNIERTPEELAVFDAVCSNPKTFFKSQQLGEDDLSFEAKHSIVQTVFDRSKANFLARFGQCLSGEQLALFDPFTRDEQDGYEVSFHLVNLRKGMTGGKDVKNRRYEAIKRLTENSSYFSETEMMRRNPLLYDQLVGRYLTDEEKDLRDNIDKDNLTLVSLLMETMDRKQMRQKLKEQQDLEDNAMEEEDSDSEIENASLPEIAKMPQQVEKEKEEEEEEDEDEDDDDSRPPTTSLRWGEFEGAKQEESQSRPEVRPRSQFVGLINAEEKRLLKEEFISIMHRQFLDGKDEDFDYSTVDLNGDYDSIDMRALDEEDKYFESESPTDMQVEAEVVAEEADENGDSEDELDTYMNRLHQHPAVAQLSKDMENL